MDSAAWRMAWCSMVEVMRWAGSALLERTPKRARLSLSVPPEVKTISELRQRRKRATDRGRARRLRGRAGRAGGWSWRCRSAPSRRGAWLRRPRGAEAWSRLRPCRFGAWFYFTGWVGGFASRMAHGSVFGYSVCSRFQERAVLATGHELLILACIVFTEDSAAIERVKDQLRFRRFTLKGCSQPHRSISLDKDSWEEGFASESDAAVD